MSEETSASCIFEGFKAIGLVINDKPFLIRYVNKLEDIRIITCVGKYFYVFNSKLQMLEASHAHENEINVMTSDTKKIYTAASSEIFIWKNGHKNLIKVLKFHECKIKFLLSTGLQLISIDEESNFNITDIKTKELVATIPFHNYLFKISAILHPSTYINKILLGSEQGSLQLFNIRRQKCIFTFKGWKSKVTCLVQSPVIDVVAIGLFNGDIYIHNIKHDETMMKFTQEWGEIVRLTFRTDSQPFLISSSNLGHLAIWDLENQRLYGQMKNIHKGPITGCEFIFKESLLVTSSNDNKLKVWRFDEYNDKGTLLYLREGHNLPPTKIKFYSEQGHQILSSSLDCTLRNFSIFSERLNRNLGYATRNKKLGKKLGLDKDLNKLNPIIDFAFELTREKDFDNIVTIHENDICAVTWMGEKNKLGNHKLVPKKHLHTFGIKATAVEMTLCGNFVLVGYNSGHIEKFNIQSGFHRATFHNEDNENELYSKDSKEITSIKMDGINSILTSCNGNFLKFWNYKTTKLIDKIDFKAKISKLIIHRQNSIVALSLLNNEINLVDLETKNIIRKFNTSNVKVNDLVFTTDCKWLIVAFDDKSIKVFDLITAQLVDHFLLLSACKSISISPTNEFLATSFVDQREIYLWSNLTLYVPTLIKPLKKNHIPKLLDLPTGLPDENTNNEDLMETEKSVSIKYDLEKDIQESMEIELVYKSPIQLSKELITLSTLPSSRWKNLLQLDLIKKRNKPKQPVEKPKDAPFFLPIIHGLTPKFDLDSNEKEEKNEDKSKSRVINQLISFSEFGKLLFDYGQNKNNCYKILQILKELGPSRIDVEIRSLDCLPPSSSNIKFKEPILLLYFLQVINQLLTENQDFELLNSYLALFVKIHCDVLIQYPVYMKQVENIYLKLEKSWNRLDKIFTENTCILNYIRSIVL